MTLTEINAQRDHEEKDDGGRIGQYKNLTKHEELRRRRTECSVEIRKAKGADMMMKRRNIVEVEDEEEYTSDTEANEIGKGTKLPSLTHDEIARILANNPTIEQTIQCMEALRKSLSKNKNPPIDDVIKSGLLKALVQALSIDNNTILYEAAWAITNIVSGTTEQTLAAVQCGATEPLVRLSVHDSAQISEQALWAVANIAGDSAQLRDYVIQCHGVEALMMLMDRVDKLEPNHVRTIAWAFSNMCRHKAPHAPIEVLRTLSKGLTILVQHPDTQVRQDACWAVSYLTDGPDEQIELARECGVLQHVVKFFTETESLVAPALRTLGNVATGNDKLTQTVVDLGALEMLHPLFMRTRSTSIVKEICWLISNVIAGTQSQIQAVIDAKLLPIIVQTLAKGDFKCQFEASWAVSNLAQGGTPRQMMALVEESVIPAICGCLHQTNTDMLNNVLETLYAVMNCVQNNYPTQIDQLRDQIEELGGLDNLERLQESSSENIYNQSYRIISQFFTDDDNGHDAENTTPAGEGPYAF